MNFGSLYTRLRLTAVASQSEIKSAYYRLSKIYHPDKNNSCPRATIQFRNITEAYEVLSNPKSKAIYDKEFFPKEQLKGAAARFRTSNRRRRFQESIENCFEELDPTVGDRMKQYRNQVEKNSKLN